MLIRSFEVKTSQPKMLMEAMAQSLSSRDYVNNSEKMFIVGSEEYKFRNNSTQMNLIVVKMLEEGCLVDIIGAAGGAGLLNVSWWSESGFIKRVIKSLKLYCDQHQIDWTEINNE